MTSNAERTADALLAMAQMIKDKATADGDFDVAETPLSELALILREIIATERKAGRIPMFKGITLH